ncbi:MAG: hypothetical protein R3A11_09045 [Bdellovibrionota bacterium]
MRRRIQKAEKTIQKEKVRSLRVRLPFERKQPEMERPVLYIPNPYEQYRAPEKREEETPAIERGVWTIDI